MYIHIYLYIQSRKTFLFGIIYIFRYGKAESFLSGNSLIVPEGIVRAEAKPERVVGGLYLYRFRGLGGGDYFSEKPNRLPKLGFLW